MKKAILALITLFTQTNSFAMHTLASARSMRMPNHSYAQKPHIRHYSSPVDDAARKRWDEMMQNKALNDARKWYDETMQKAHKYSDAINLIRKEEKEKIKSVALQGDKLKKAVDNRDIRRKTFLGCPDTEANDCDNDYLCLCHEEIKAELETLQKMMRSLELSQKSLQKLREISNEHWETRNKAMHHYHKILEDEIKNLFESKNNKNN
jgi:hypothetical protein